MMFAGRLGGRNVDCVHVATRRAARVHVHICKLWSPILSSAVEEKAVGQTLPAGCAACSRGALLELLLQLDLPGTPPGTGLPENVPGGLLVRSHLCRGSAQAAAACSMPSGSAYCSCDCTIHGTPGEQLHRHLCCSSAQAAAARSTHPGSGICCCSLTCPAGIQSRP